MKGDATRKKGGKRLSIKRPKRRALPLWYRPGVRVAVFTAMFLAIAAGGWWLRQSGWVDVAVHHVETKVIDVSSRAGFNVRDILVSGRHETSRKELLAALDLERGVPILAFDPDATRMRLEALPWVREARIERRLPDTVYVDIDERRPLALWQKEGRHLLIDTDGVVILQRNTERFAHLPVVVGVDAPDHAAYLLDVLRAEAELAPRVKAAVRIGGRRWDVSLDNGIFVKLPEENEAEAWARLADYQREHDLLSRDITLIDLRVDGRLIVRVRSGGDETLSPVKGTRGA